jgi:cell division protein ZapA
VSGTSEPVSIRLLDREYTVGVDADGRDSLMAAARLLEEKMREVRGANRIAAVDRVAVLAALNIAHEMLSQQQSSQKQASTMLDDLGTLRARIDATLANIAAR